MSEENDLGRISLANVIAVFLLAVGMWASIFVYENIQFTALITVAMIVYLLRLSPETIAKIVDLLKRLFGTDTE